MSIQTGSYTSGKTIDTSSIVSIFSFENNLYFSTKHNPTIYYRNDGQIMSFSRIFNGKFEFKIENLFNKFSI